MNTDFQAIRVVTHGELWKTNLLLLNETSPDPDSAPNLKDVKFIGMKVSTNSSVLHKSIIPTISKFIFIYT